MYIYIYIYICMYISLRNWVSSRALILKTSFGSETYKSTSRCHPMAPKFKGRDLLFLGSY